jgi:hypothetical protein
MPSDAFCGRCGAPVQGALQSYQQPQMQLQPQLQENAPISQQSYQQPQMSPTNANVQPGPQPYQQPQMAKPIEQSVPQSGYQQPSASRSNKTVKKGNRAFGVALLGIGAVLFIVWLVIKITQPLDWYEGLIPFIYAKYFKDGWLTALSFISPFILWGAGLLVLAGLGSFLPDKEDK